MSQTCGIVFWTAEHCTDHRAAIQGLCDVLNIDRFPGVSRWFYDGTAVQSTEFRIVASKMKADEVFRLVENGSWIGLDCGVPEWGERIGNAVAKEIPPEVLGDLKLGNISIRFGLHCLTTVDNARVVSVAQPWCSVTCWGYRIPPRLEEFGMHVAELDDVGEFKSALEHAIGQLQLYIDAKA